MFIPVNLPCPPLYLRNPESKRQLVIREDYSWKPERDRLTRDTHTQIVNRGSRAPQAVVYSSVFLQFTVSGHGEEFQQHLGAGIFSIIYVAHNSGLVGLLNRQLLVIISLRHDCSIR